MKLKVLLVDDELHFTSRLKTSVDWKSLEMEICGIAQDGNMALAMAKQTNPDIVITDICMPLMSGLELCKILLKEQPNIQIILISGHAEFSYAKEAIGIGVQAYCLKPLNTEELTANLVKARRAILQVKLSQPDKLLDAMEANDLEELNSVLQELELSTGPYYLAVSAQLGNIASTIKADYSCKLGSHKYMYLSKKPYENDNLISCTCFATKGGIGVVKNPLSAQQLAQSVGDATAMAYQYFIMGKACVCRHMVENSSTNTVFTQLESVITSKIQLEQFLNTLLSCSLNDIFNIRSAFRFYNLICSGDIMHSVFDEKERYFYGYEELVAEYETLIDAFEDLKNSLLCAAPVAVSQANTNFLNIIKYINENYSKDLSLKKVADYFHMNASYISQLIKSETSLTYTQYVNELRMNRAKHLLKTTDMSLAQISETIGINDYFYFIKRFKKDAGITPGKYR